MKNSENLKFEYTITTNEYLNENDYKTVDLKYNPDLLQEITTLKLFGADSVVNNKLTLLPGFAYHVYLTPNIQNDNKRSIVNDFLKRINPNLNGAKKGCEDSCEKCVYNMCLKCKEGFILNFTRCTREESKRNFRILLKQDNLTICHHKSYE